MNAVLHFEFSVDKENRAINVQRDFAADLPLVWDAWTKPELLDLWWAPKPYKTKTKSMEFKEGGSWLYAMISPENVPHWCRVDFKEIEQQKRYSALDGFCNEEGVLIQEFPRSNWTNLFKAKGETTEVKVTIQFDDLSDLEKIIAMGFKEGFTMALGNLDQYLEAQFRLRKEFKTDQAQRVCSYLNFPGNTEKAFLFYKSVFKTEFIGGGIQRFGEIPQEAGVPPIAESVKKMVLHVELPITGNYVLMGTDAPKELGFTLTPGNNMHICIEPDSRAETQRIFEQLSEGGNITMPLKDMFWGAYYGSFTDKFGINWMVNYQTKPEEQEQKNGSLRQLETPVA